MQAAATTQPKSDPLPTSSTPAITLAPFSRAAFSNFVVQCRLFSSRNLAAEAEIASVEPFDPSVWVRRTTLMLGSHLEEA